MKRKINSFLKSNIFFFLNKEGENAIPQIRKLKKNNNKNNFSQFK